MPVNEYIPPGGEALQQLHARTEDVWATLCRLVIATILLQLVDADIL